MLNLSRSLVSLVLALGVALSLSACGRKGDLDPPSVAAKQQDKYGQKSEVPAPASPDKKFILDPLL